MPRVWGSYVSYDWIKCTECGRNFLETCDTCTEKKLRIAECMLAVALHELRKRKKTHAEILKAIREAGEQKAEVVGKEIDREKKRMYFRMEVEEELGAHEREFYREYGARAWKKREKTVRKQIEKAVREKEKAEKRDSKKALEVE